MVSLDHLEAMAGLTFLPYQAEAIEAAATQQGDSGRLCLYYKTGAGKSYTSLAIVRVWGRDAAVVIAPPSTHAAWEAAGDRFNVEVRCMSHAKFRMADTKLARDVAVIADEMHMFGGHGGKGWKKLEALAKGLRAPMVLASATPNYNDAERVYCIERILHPERTKGGYLQFLYANCTTEQNQFGMTPIVTGFQRHENAAEYLAELPRVEYLPDDLEYEIRELTYPVSFPDEFERYGLDRRRGRIIASQMEERHTRTFQGLVSEDGLVHHHIYEMLTDLAGSATTPLLVYADHSTVADALGRSLSDALVPHAVVTGKTTKKDKDRLVQEFKDGKHDVLVGTASLATGTDGLDKMCDWLVILDDTTDDSLRRQLIGRIMPRGLDTDASRKQVYRLLPL